MAERAFFLDQGHGESRGVVTLEGRAERLLIVRDGDIPCQALGARSIGRVARIERGAALAFIAVADGPEAVLNLKPGAPPLTQGQAVEIEVKSEARADKGAIVRIVGPANGPPRLTAPAPDLTARMEALAKGYPVETGNKAREVADRAQEEALETWFALPGGGRIAVETTRALSAVDVDLGAGQRGEAKAATKSANLQAIGEAARVLRLKGLGGMVVIDLVGRGHDGPALLAAARAAFAPDNPGVAIGPVSRFGLMELAIPRRTRPTIDLLCGGRAMTSAMMLLRALEREARADPGGRFAALAAPDIAKAAEVGLGALIAKLGARLSLSPEADRTGFEIVRR